jgi:hypothetical protein
LTEHPGASANDTVARKPPAGSFASSSSPPCAFTMPRAIPRPRPMPLLFWRRPCSSRTYGSNRLAKAACGTPGPWSRIVISIWVPVWRTAISTCLP